VENGDLLSRASAAGFDALLTMDTGVQYEQNLVKLPIAVVLLRALSNDIDDLRPLLPALLQALTALPPRQIARVP
jgi:hypothetical protein